MPNVQAAWIYMFHMAFIYIDEPLLNEGCELINIL